MVRADKNFGQHFLINEGVVRRIADTVAGLNRPLENEWVVEIGPGPGVLTHALLERGLKVAAVELDRRMIEALNARFAAEIAARRLVLINGDACRTRAEELPPEALAKPLVFCGNLPYNVGTTIVFHVLEQLPQAEAFCFMLQKEVVQRLKSEPGSKSYGIPSVKLAWSVDHLDHFWVNPGSFNPPPKVDSGVLSYRRLRGPALLADPLVRGGPYDRASRLLNRLFQNRRKMIGSVAKELRDQPEARQRPEELAPARFLELTAAAESDRAKKNEID